jgi:predicted PurR-regulated permease PerM
MSDPRRDHFRPPEITSPPWQTGTRLMMAGLMILFVTGLVLVARSILGLVVVALLLAYLLHPLVELLEKRLRFSRTGAVLVVYVLLIGLLVGGTTGIGVAIIRQIIGLIEGLSQFVDNVPALLEQVVSTSISVGPWTLDLSNVNLDPVANSIASTLQPLLGRTGTLLASAVGTTATTLALLIIILVMGYYLLRDFDSLGNSILNLVPHDYQTDFSKLMDETGRVWSSFLRGQLILGLVMGGASAAVYGALGLRFALGLGLITGLMEFIPIFGPYIAGTVAVIAAIFQSTNGWGLSPSAFILMVFAAAVILQQVENVILVPRIIGHSLRLHPLIVLIATITGGLLAGFLGILLAAPTVATFRLWGGYVYRKTVGLDQWPAPVIEDRKEAEPESFRQRLGDMLPPFMRSSDPTEIQPNPGDQTTEED